MSALFTLYGDSRSGNCLKVLWTANYLGTACRWVETDIMQGASRTPEFLAINPFGQVPTAVFGDGSRTWSLTQSNAIALHLAEQARHPTFLPIEAAPRAAVYAWMFWEQNSHEPYIAGMRFRRMMKGLPLEEIDPEWMPRGHAALARMEAALQVNRYLTGEHLTVADVSLLAYTRVAHEGDFDLAPYPNLLSWISRVEKDLNLDPIER